MRTLHPYLRCRTPQRNQRNANVVPLTGRRKSADVSAPRPVNQPEIKSGRENERQNDRGFRGKRSQGRNGRTSAPPSQSP
jgi:hypothetical protein